MVDTMSNKHMLLIAITLGFIGGFSFVAAASSSGYSVSATEIAR